MTVYYLAYCFVFLDGAVVGNSFQARTLSAFGTSAPLKTLCALTATASDGLVVLTVRAAVAYSGALIEASWS